MRRFLAACTLVAAIVAGCSARPVIRVHDGNGGVVIDVQTLGEYPTTVKKVRLSDASTGEVVWELRGKSNQPGGPQLATFPLNVGENPSQIDHVMYGTYEVVVPRNANVFTLQRGVEYELTLWGKYGPADSATISIGPSRKHTKAVAAALQNGISGGDTQPTYGFEEPGLGVCGRRRCDVLGS